MSYSSGNVILSIVWVEADTTAFKNAAQSNQRRSQLNFECGAVKIKGLIRWLEYIQSHWMWLAFGQSKWQSNFKFPAFLDMMSQLYVVESLVDQNLPSPLVAKTITPPGVQLWWQSCSSCVCYIFVTLRLIFCPYCWILDSFSGVLFALLRLAI